MFFEKHSAKLPHGVNDLVKDLLDEDLREDEPDAGGNQEETDRIPRQLFVERYHIACFFISILSYIFDIGSDLYVGIAHYQAGRIVPAIFVGIFAVVPSIVLNFVSFAWESDDRDARNDAIKDETPRRPFRELAIPLPLVLLMCVFQLGPIWAHAKAIHYALCFRKTSDEKKKRFLFCKMIEAERDATLLRLLEGFLESAPQLIVQSTVLYEFLWLRLKVVAWYKLPTWAYFQIGSLALSLFSLSWSITSQHRTIRIASPDKVNVHPHETFLQLIWRASTICSRILVIGMCIMYLKFTALIFGGLHFTVSMIHISALQTVDFGPGRRLLQLGVLLITAFLHLFAPFNIAEGQTRWRYFCAYSIEVIEAIIVYYLVLIDNNFQTDWKWEFATVSVISFCLGLTIMVFYYGCCHPNRRRHKRIEGSA